MLRLNPGDNQGVRYILAGWLLSLDRLDELDELLDRFDEDSATWAYTRALAGLPAIGRLAGRRKQLQAAKKANKHVPAYLLGRKPLPPEQPPFYSPGDEDDAIIYVGQQPGGLEVGPRRDRLGPLEGQGPPHGGSPSRPASVGPSPAAQERLRRLPSELDAWQADFRQFARRVEIAGERVRPWMVLVSSRTRDLVLAHALTEQAPSPEVLWDIVAGAMEQPAAGEPHRPSRDPGPPEHRLGGPGRPLRGDRRGLLALRGPRPGRLPLRRPDPPHGGRRPARAARHARRRARAGRPVLRGRRRVLPPGPLAVARATRR